MDRSRYFDNAATTPLDPRVREAMLPFLGDKFGNANSIHAAGLAAREAVEKAREQVAALIGAEDPSQIYFTSGATESNNWVLNAASQVWVSPFEHSAMREPALAKGAKVFPNRGLLIEPLNETGGRTLVSVMSVNNEIGAKWDVREIAANSVKHVDATQSIGKLPFAVLGLDFVSGSAHKFYGPKGIGFLYCASDPPPPLIIGGEQEHGLRGGTLPVPNIVGMGAAAQIAADEIMRDSQNAEKCRNAFLENLHISDVHINGGENASPYILSISFPDVQGEALVLELDSGGYAISAGAACSSQSTEPSHVLTALGLPEELIRGTVRISFGRFSTPEESAALAKKMRQAVEMFRTL